MKKFLTTVFMTLILALFTHAAGWNSQTTNWSNNPNPVVGDWGFNRPGYPSGLYIHGVTVPEGEPVTNPVIYDNDIYDDVTDDEWMWAMTSLGKMNLVGVISTPVLTTFWPPFYRPDWEASALESYDNAANSGMFLNGITGITFGSRAEGVQDTDGAQLYIQAAHATEPGKPLIVNMGGQSATLASAYMLDPSIADKIIVYYTAINNYNGHYAWASEIVAQNFRVVEFYFDGPSTGLNWWRDHDCQNQWNVLPRPAGCGNPTVNPPNSGEWAQLSNLNKPILDHFIYVMQNKPWFDARDPVGHSGGRASDGYHDGTFIHAWAPGIFTAAQFMNSRGGQVLKITNFSESVAKNATFPIITNPAAYDGVPPAGITVNITSPASGTSFEAPASITINADASVNDGNITLVEFFEGETKLGEDNTAPYSFTWSDVQAGEYSITARATDNNNNSATSSPVAVSVLDPVDVTGIQVNPTNLTVGLGQTSQITAIVEPSNATNKQVHWSSNNSSVATVDQDGNVTGVQEGTAIITATTDQFGFTAQSTVTVIPVTTHTIRLEVINGWNYVSSFRYLNDGTWTTVPYNSPEISHNFLVHSSGWLESQTTGNYAEFTFTGTAIELIAKKLSWGGTGRIYIDGVPQTPDVSFQGPSEDNVVIFEKSDLGSGVQQYNLTTNTIGQGSVSPSSGTFNQGQEVSLTATPEDCYQFAGWSGDASGTQNPINITMDSNKEVTATFEALPTYTLTVNSQNGSVAKNPDQTDYCQGEQVYLTASPDSGYEFAGWSGDASGVDNPISVTMDANKTITANFTESAIGTHTIRLEVISGWNYVNSFRYLSNGTWTTVAYNSPEINHNFLVHGGGWLESQTADHYVDFTFTGTAIQLVAKTVSWGGTGRIYLNGVLQSPNANFQGPSQENVIIFEETNLDGGVTQYNLTINTSGQGSVAKSPDKASYNQDEQVTLTATPDSGYQFSGWSGDASGTDNPINITMDSHKSITANFTETAVGSHTIRLEVVNGWNYVKSFQYLDEGVWTTVPYNSQDISHNFLIHSGGWLESQTTGNHAELTFTGTGIRLIGTRLSWGGTGRIFVDGIQQTPDVSFYSSTTQENAIIFEKTDLMSQLSGNAITSITDSQAARVLVYPNPLGVGNLSIELPYESKYTITMISISGQVVYRTTTTDRRHEINRELLSKGIYVLSIQSKNFLNTKRVIVK